MSPLVALHTKTVTMAASSTNVQEKNVKKICESNCTTQNLTEICDFKDKYYSELSRLCESQTGAVKTPWTREKVFEVIQHIKNARVAMKSGLRRTAAEYYWYSRYDVMNIAGLENLILKKNKPDSSTVLVIPMEEYYDILVDIHNSCGHGGRDKIQYKLKDKFIIVRKAIDLFVSLCPICKSKRSIPKKGILTKPVISKDFNERGQVDLIDLQSTPDGHFKWILHYQDHATKFVHLRPLCSKEAKEVAFELLKIFLEFGPPCILQSDSEQEFTAKIIEEILDMWPECKIIHGTPCHPQTQGSVCQNVENMLQAWMRDNNSTKWATGCFFIQYSKNTTLHRLLGRSPFQALFSCEPKSGLQYNPVPNIPYGILNNINAEPRFDENHLDASSEHQNNVVQAAELQKHESSENFKYSVYCENRIVTKVLSNTNPENKIDASFSISTVKRKDSSTNDVLPVITESNVALEKSIPLLNTSVHLMPLKSSPNKDHENPALVVANCIPITSDKQTLRNKIEHNSPQLLTNSANKNIGLNENSDLSCAVCRKGASVADQCSSCQRAVHSICGITRVHKGYGSRILCYVCKTELDIRKGKQKAYKDMKRAAEKNICDISKKVPALDSEYFSQSSKT